VQVPLLLWVAAVVVIFSVSQNSLKGLQVRTAAAWARVDGIAALLHSALD
jgi:hypothetical protein